MARGGAVCELPRRYPISRGRDRCGTFGTRWDRRCREVTMWPELVYSGELGGASPGPSEGSSAHVRTAAQYQGPG
jgi:hypothetical protein